MIHYCIMCSFALFSEHRVSVDTLLSLSWSCEPLSPLSLLLRISKSVNLFSPGDVPSSVLHLCSPNWTGCVARLVFFFLLSNSSLPGTSSFWLSPFPSLVSFISYLLYWFPLCVCVCVCITSPSEKNCRNTYTVVFFNICICLIF